MMLKIGDLLVSKSKIQLPVEMARPRLVNFLTSLEAMIVFNATVVDIEHSHFIFPWFRCVSVVCV